mmetsp:Transcript_143517/g.458959  ORF Transcript_143517/g.458959 Transcript_143517/m.458959 type:complete len:146 (+) Transcript_143517:136-573(+)
MADSSKASGGLFRTDGGVRATSGLDVSDPEIADAWAKVRSDGSEETWLLLGYEGKTKLKVHSTGGGGAVELLEAIDDSQVLFGGLRTKEGKFLCLMCSGQDAGAMARGRAGAHKKAAVNALDGTVDEVCGNNKEEFCDKLSRVSF